MDCCKLMEMPYSGPKYTWTNGWEGVGRIEERIDYNLCNDLWSSKFPAASLRHLLLTSSDHCSLLLSTVPIREPNKPEKVFKFQAAWLDHKEFKPFLQSIWENGGGPLHEVLSKCADSLLWWRLNVFGNMQQKKRRCYARLEGLQKARYAHPSNYLYVLEGSLREELHELLQQEEIY